MATAISSTDILQELLEIPGANTVLVVGWDGFVIESAGTSGKFDIDTVGASVAMILNGAEKMGSELNIASFHTLTLEAADAMIMCSPAGDALLVIIASDSKTLGMIRLQAKKKIPALAEFF